MNKAVVLGRSGPSVDDEAAEVAAFLREGGRITVLVAETAAARSALLDGVLARLQGPAVQVGNKLNSPLTLHRILFQAGAIGTEVDKSAALMRSLGRQTSQGRINLAITEAQTLTPDALTTLIRIAITARFELRLLLLGLPSLLHAAGAPGFDALRDPTVTMVCQVREAGQAQASSTRGGAVPGRNVSGQGWTRLTDRAGWARTLARHRWLAWSAGLGAIALGALGLFAGRWDGVRFAPPDAFTSSSGPPYASVQSRSEESRLDGGQAGDGRAAEDPLIPGADPGRPTPPGPAVETDDPQTSAQEQLTSTDRAHPGQKISPAAPIEPPEAVPPDAQGPAPGVTPGTSDQSTAPPVTADEAMPTGAEETDRLSKEFDVFLNHAGRDTASLQPAARAVLFKEYLAWRARHAPP